MGEIKTYKTNSQLYYSLIFVIILSCTPLLRNVMGYILSWLILLPLVLSKINSRSFTENSGVITCSLLFIAINLVYRIFGISTAQPGYYLGLLLFFMIVMILPLVPKSIDKRKQHKLWWILMIVMLFNVADNIRLSILYPEINTMRFYLDKSFLSSINAGDDSFYTFSLFFFCVCFFIWLNVEQKKVKWFSLIVAVITAVYICWYCFKASIVLFFLLSVFLIFYAKKTTHLMLFFVITAISAIISFFLLEVYSETIVDYIISVSPNRRLTVRLVTLLDENADEAQANTVTGRTTLYMLSIKTWLTNIVTFFVGIGDHYTVLHAAKTGIGQHADLPDTLARYGIVGFSVIIMMLRNCIKYILSLFDQKYRLQVLTIFMIYIIYGCVKIIFFAGVGCALFILLPLSSIFLKRNKTEKK